MALLKNLLLKDAHKKTLQLTLAKYGFTNLETEEQKKVNKLGVKVAEHLVKSFKKLAEIDGYLMDVDGEGKTTVSWLIHAFSEKNAEDFYSFLEVLVHFKLIYRSNCETLKTNLSNLNDEEVKALSKLSQTIKMSQRYLNLNKEEELQYSKIVWELCQKERRKFLPQLWNLVNAITQAGGISLLPYDYKRWVFLDNIETIKNLQESLSLLLKNEVFLTKSMFDILLTDNGQRHSLIALQRKVIKTLAESKLCNKNNLNGLFDYLIVYYDGSQEQKKCLHEVFSCMIQTEKGSVGLRQYVLDEQIFPKLERTIPTVPCNANATIQWGDVEELAAQVLKSVQSQNSRQSFRK